MNICAWKLVFFVSVKTDSSSIEPILYVLRRRREGASGRAPYSTKPGDRAGSCKKEEVKGEGTGGVSYVKEEAKRTAPSRACGVRGP